jgi:uncharacterized protein YndB with AHSA1/START domain
MSDEEQTPSRAIELSVEVPGTPEQVWQAIATGPGISAWFVPTEVEEREGGVITQDFGMGMRVEGRVARWEPPVAFAFGAADGSPDASLFFEFLVETRDGGGAVVRLVNSGFGTGEDWDAQYDGMTEGWQLFLDNLRLHLTHFAGRHCETFIVNGLAAGPREAAWKAYMAELGLPERPAVGDRVATSVEPRITGTVARATPAIVSLLTDEPAPGVAFLAVEGAGDQVSTSLYAYLYGPGAEAFMTDGSQPWRAWMHEHFPAPVE